ncbi:Aminopeptidase M1-like protein [Drosera capensis]
MATTQFEPVDARRCFPCWDEPALKATFEVTVVVPTELIALSNMPVFKQEPILNMNTVHFKKSPLMSTYLLAFVVGEFDSIEDVTDDVYCPVGQSHRGKLGLSLALRALDFFGEYFSMPYPLPKLDMVAVPDFSCGAMENYGLIIFREVELLHDDDSSAAASKQGMVIAVAHEEPTSGSGTWLQWNGGRICGLMKALRHSYLAVDHFFPEWNIWSQFLEETEAGLRLDALEQSHPIEVEVGHARSVDEIFDAISYCKGSAVIRMLEDFLGHKVFQESLSSYMKKYAGGNAKTEDLWRVLTEEAGIEVDKMMTSWTKQKGYPVISVRLEGNILEFKQSQFLLSGAEGGGQWIVPVSLSAGSYSRCKKFLLETKSRSVDVSELLDSSSNNSSATDEKNQSQHDEDVWIKVNVR